MRGLRGFKFIISVFILFLPFLAEAQDVYRDSFPDGRPELRWSFFPYFNLDNLKGARDTKTPDGGNGIGVLKNTNVGGFASLSYTVTKQMENLYLEVMVLCV